MTFPPNQNPYPAQAPYPVNQGKRSTLATLSLIFGIMSLVCCCGFVAGLPAAIMGFVELGNIREGRSDPSNRSMAMAGAILGCVAVGLSIIGFILQIMFGAFGGLLQNLNRSGHLPTF